MTKEGNENSKNSTKCWIYDNNCVDNDIKARNHFQTPLFYEDPPILHNPFFKFCPFPPLLLPPTPPPLSFCCLVYLAEWVIVLHLMCHFT